MVYPLHHLLNFTKLMKSILESHFEEFQPWLVNIFVFVQVLAILFAVNVRALLFVTSAMLIYKYIFVVTVKESINNSSLNHFNLFINPLVSLSFSVLQLVWKEIVRMLSKKEIKTMPNLCSVVQSQQWKQQDTRSTSLTSFRCFCFALVLPLFYLNK